MTRSLSKLDQYRLVAGPGIVFNSVADDEETDGTFRGVQPELHLALKVRFFNPSRRAKNKFAFEFGPAVDAAIVMNGGTDIGVENNFIYKVNKWFGAGIFAAPTWHLGGSGPGNDILPLVKVGGDVQLWEDRVRLRGGIIATDADARHMGSFAQVVLDIGAWTMAFAGR